MNERGGEGETYGFLLDFPPPGPAVPLSDIVYVDCSLERVDVANSATISAVGPR